MIDNDTFFADELPETTEDAAWLIRPFFPREGIVLLYGKKGTGKSPLTWLLAQSVATGTPWLKYPVQETGEVLYLEVDTPRVVVTPRMRKVMTAHNIVIHFPSGSIADVTGWATLQEKAKAWNPALVIVNTLRKVHIGEDVKSNVPSLVYSRFRNLWPHACLCFVHHEKKTPTNPDHQMRSGEEFSGSLAWANDAQVVLRVWRHRGRPSREGHETILTMSGNQLAPLEGPVRYYLIHGLIGPEVEHSPAEAPFEL